MLLENLIISSLMMALTIGIHFLGLAGLIAVLRGGFAQRWREGSAFRRGVLILGTVFGLVALHAIEIWAYTILYMLHREFDDLETALYFATVTFTTVGYGDVVIGSARRLIAAIESVNGFLLIGWSTAFLVSVTAKMGLLEAQLEASQRLQATQDRKSP